MLQFRLQTGISDVEQGFWFFIKHAEIFWYHEPESQEYDCVTEIHDAHSHFPWVKLLKLLFSSRLMSNEVSVLVDLQQC